MGHKVEWKKHWLKGQREKTLTKTKHGMGKMFNRHNIKWKTTNKAKRSRRKNMDEDQTLNVL